VTQPCVKDAESNPAGASYLERGCTVFFRDFFWELSPPRLLFPGFLFYDLLKFAKTIVKRCGF
jgi:hypothetical protein